MRQETKRNFTITYHDIFEYPLKGSEITLWQPGKRLGREFRKRILIEKKGEYLFLKGRGRLVKERQKREAISARKIEIARKGAKIISFIPSVKMVAVTGAIAMNNAKKTSDVDLFIICKKGKLWITRLITILLLDVLGIPRNASGKVERDKLCLNMWLDESDLIWDRKDRNFYTAHEVVQIIPLVNKNDTYERFVRQNIWIKDFWPNALGLKKQVKLRFKKTIFDLLIYPFELLAYSSQYIYMRERITREIVTPTRAIFHPRDWGHEVSLKLRHLTK